MTDKQPGFLRNHADTLTIIAVIVGLGAIMMSLWLSNSSRVDSAHNRIDCVIYSDGKKIEDLKEKYYELLIKDKK